MAQKLSISEVADRYRISTRSVRRYISRGDLTAIRVGPKLIRIDADEADRKLGAVPVQGGAL